MSLLGRLLHRFTRGWYGRYWGDPATGALRCLRSTMGSLRRKRRELDRLSAREDKALHEFWQEMKQREYHSQLENRPLEDLARVRGVGDATIEKLRKRSVRTFRDLASNPAFLSQLRRVPLPVQLAMRRHLEQAITEARRAWPTLRPDDVLTQRAVTAALEHGRLASAAEELTESILRLKRVRRRLPLSPLFSHAIGRPPHLDAAALDFVQRQELEAAEALERLCGEQKLVFGELSAEQYIRGVSAIEKLFGVRGTGLPPGLSRRLGLPSGEGLLAQITGCDLDTGLMTNCILRRYQEFGAKFILVARHSLLGDEMGLGKTVQALAAMCHVAAGKCGTFRATVVVPAGLRENWRREIETKTALRPLVLHGAGGRSALADWHTRGGVAILSYSALRQLAGELSGKADRIDFAVADEAQYVKNVGSQRTAATRALFRSADYSLVMTGTPIENRPEEFAVVMNTVRHSVRHLRQVEQGAGIGTPSQFKRIVEPVYLRRNKEDVLTELPDLIETDEWVELAPTDLAEHLQVMEGWREAWRRGWWATVMALRQHAIFAGGARRSRKMTRVRELVDEHRGNGRSVVVFTFFREAISALEQLYPDAHVVHGGVSSVARSEVIDQFTASSTSSTGALLVSQINAGGLGLNMQAGSVAVIVEPQVNPAVEYQAVCRLHRMGQRQSVNVHRIVARDTIEEDLHEMLARKRRCMELYARDSLLKESSQAAVSRDEIAALLEVRETALRQALAG